MIERPNGGGWESAQATGQRGQASEASRNVRLAHLAPILTPSAARSPRADEDFHGLCLYRPKSEAGAAPNAYTCQLTEPSQPCHWPASQVGKLRHRAGGQDSRPGGLAPESSLPGAAQVPRAPAVQPPGPRGWGPHQRFPKHRARWKRESAGPATDHCIRKPGRCA